MRRLLVVLLFTHSLLASEPMTTPGVVLQERDGRSTPIHREKDSATVRLIVEVRPGASMATFRRDLGRLNAARVASGDARREGALHVRHEYSRVARGAAIDAPESAIPDLAALATVQTVRRDRIYRALEEPNVVAVRAPEVWSGFSIRGEGIVVAVLDSGIDYKHPALGGGIGSGFKVVGGRDFVQDDDDPMDENGHGTHVAGIIAANSQDLLGVAPAASLLAYRVLDENGDGYGTDVVAAIERALDPNGDGDFTDRADVINLSLGASGGPEDIVSRAVNAAVDAGVVVCAAAGNSGAGGLAVSIDSPGVAEKAITVGAAENDGRAAYFSSNGPSVVNYTIKPDLVAPGVNVRSTGIGGTYRWMAGTSMATPHVAGIAALLRQQHPEWTPAQIKGALISNTQASNGRVMQTGSGRADALRALSGTIVIDPPSVNLGVTNGVDAQFKSKRTVRFTNRGETSQTLTITPPIALGGVALTVTPSTVTLGAGETGEVEVEVTVDNTKVPFESTFSRGGVLQVKSGSDTYRMACAFVKGLRSRVAFDGDLYGIHITDQNEGRYDPAQVSDGEFETLVRPGTYDITIYGPTYDSAAATFFTVLEQQEVTGDRAFTLRKADIRYRIGFSGATENGVPLYPTPAGMKCYGHRSLAFPDGSRIDQIRVLGAYSNTAIATSALSPRFGITGGDVCRDEDFMKMRVVHYEGIFGVTGDVTRSAGGSDLRPVRVDVHFPQFVDGARRILLTAAGYTPLTRGDFGFSEVWSKPVWNGTIYMAAVSEFATSTHPAPRAQVFTPTGGFGTMLPDPLRIVDGRVASFRSRTAPPFTPLWPIDAPVTLGAGFVVPRPFFWSYGWDEVTLELAWGGSGQEEHDSVAPPAFRIVDLDGKQLATGAGGGKIPLENKLRLVTTTEEYEWRDSAAAAL